jgi:SAM-dependent methyltransferase
MTATDHTVSQRAFALTQCTACGFCITNPRPAPQEIGTFYESTSYISHTNASTGLQNRLYQWARKRTIRTKHKLIAQHQPTGKLLDMGCGTGEFLAHMKAQGYQTSGIEPGLHPREQAIQHHALDVVPEIDVIPAAEQFQVITLWHVLEHVYDVKETLRKLHARMARGGLLVIAVPDRESWDATHYGSVWAAYDVPRHLSHFRRRDMHRFLTEQGFDPQPPRRMWLDALYVSMLSEKHKGAGGAFALIKGSLLGSLSNLVSATSDRPTSSSLYLAKKA